MFALIRAQFRKSEFSGSGRRASDCLHVFVADVINSFDTVYRSILDGALAR